REKKIAKYQLNARSAVIYLRGLPASATLRLPYRLKATMPVDIQIPAAKAHEYYDPDRRGRGQTTAMKVTVEA
ncbi:MAG: hypothetical protein N2C14_32915, partial [Planctomycetales bacterium]